MQITIRKIMIKYKHKLSIGTKKMTQLLYIETDEIKTLSKVISQIQCQHAKCLI